MPDPVRKVPLGEPLSAAELEQIAEARETDLEDAKARWRANAPSGFRDLLDSEISEEQESQ